MTFAGGLESGSKLEHEATGTSELTNFLNEGIFIILAVVALITVVILMIKLNKRTPPTTALTLDTLTQAPRKDISMTCKKCGHNNSQIVNTVQQKKKGHPVLLIGGIVSFAICFICIIACITILDQKGMSWELFLLNPIASITAFFFKVGVIAILLRQLMPYKTVNVLYVVCKECGHMEKLQEISNDIEEDSEGY